MDLVTAYQKSVILLEQMLAIPSTSREEKNVSDMLEEYMASTGLEVHRFNHNLWLIDPCYDAARPTLLLNAHMDTVKPVSTWQHYPFYATHEEVTLPDGSREERIYGLGSNDDGASLVTLLHVFLMLVDEPAGRNYNLIFLASAEEEVSGKNGIESALPLLPKVDVALVGEPEKTGITVNSIKIRANRKGAGGKDKTQFEWLDEHTRRHYQAKKSKNKGSTFESEIVHKLQDIGYPGCIRAAGESRSTDNNKIDIIDMEDELPVNIQCKYTMNTPSYFRISEECSDKSKPFCLLWKKAPEPGSISKGAVAIIPLDYFYELIKK